jgi:hypothetical protein
MFVVHACVHVCVCACVGKCVCVCVCVCVCAWLCARVGIVKMTAQVRACVSGAHDSGVIDRHDSVCVWGGGGITNNERR